MADAGPEGTPLRCVINLDRRDTQQHDAQTLLPEPRRSLFMGEQGDDGRHRLRELGRKKFEEYKLTKQAAPGRLH
jgi:hypothetical protein